MQLNRSSRNRQWLVAALLALPMTLAATDLAAQNCRSGSCGPNNLEKAIAKIESAESTVAKADLQTAYERIEAVSKEADELNASSSSKVRNGLKELANRLEKRANADLQDAIQRYFEGYHEQSLEAFAAIAKLNGLPSAKKAQQELDKEDDRVAWRKANTSALSLIGSKDYGQAREPLNEMDRLARRTDYTKQTVAAMKMFATQMQPEVEAGEKLIAQEQYAHAYAKLIEISRLTHARESALAARKVLAKHATLEGMRQAKGEYDAGEALKVARSWYESIANPSKQEQDAYQQKLEAIVNSYRGTTAADQALQLLGADNAQAAR